MERWQNEKEREVWRENVVFAVKYGLEHSNYTEKMQKLNETIQENEEKIKDVCQVNQKSLVDNLKQFSDVHQDINAIYDKIKAFENNIQIIIKMNIYNSTKLCNLLEARKNLDSVIAILSEFQDFINNVDKAVVNVRGENFMSSLRILNGLKKGNLTTHPANASIRKILSEVLPLINGKVRKITDDLINEWMKQLKVKKTEYAQFLANKIEEGTRRRAAKTSVAYGAKNSVARGSIYVASPQLGGPISRMSFAHNSLPESGFHRNSTVMLGIDSKFANTNFNREYTNRELTQDIKIDFYLFNQCKQIYENLNENSILYETISNMRRNQLLQSSGSEQNIQITDVRIYLANIVAFFMIQKDIEQNIPQIQDINQLWVDAGKQMEKEINRVVEAIEIKEDFIALKNDLQAFIVLLNKFGFSSQALLLNEILKAVFIKYSEKLIKDGNSTFTQKLKKDTNRPLIARDVTALKEHTLNFEIDKYAGLTLHADPAKNAYPLYLNYTQVIPDICKIILEFINDNVQYVQGNLDSESILFVQLDRLMFEVYKAYYATMQESAAMRDPLQMAQIYQNTLVLDNLTPFFKKSLEKGSGHQYKSNLESQSMCGQIIYACDEQICETVKNKLSDCLGDYEDAKLWAPPRCNDQKSYIIETTLNYLNTILLTMKQILPENTASIAFVAFKYMNDFLLDVVMNKTVVVNLAGLANLELDLISVSNVCETSLKEFPGLRECMRGIRQLLDLFLVGPFSEFIDPKIRSRKYFCLDPVKMIPLMEKYKNDSIPKLKELRKRDVDYVLKEIKKEHRIR